MDLISAEKIWPFCRSWILLEVGVDALKNASQLALIAAMVAAEPPLAAGLLAAGLDAAGLDAAGLVAVDAVAAGVVELELVLEQAVTAAASARPSAGARKIRRAM
jgi:hypothetical protein